MRKEEACESLRTACQAEGLANTLHWKQAGVCQLPGISPIWPQKEKKRNKGRFEGDDIREVSSGQIRYNSKEKWSNVVFDPK